MKILGVSSRGNLSNHLKEFGPKFKQLESVCVSTGRGERPATWNFLSGGNPHDLDLSGAKRLMNRNA